MTVRISTRTAFEPDALVVCPVPPGDAVEISNPVIVVEVLSPSTAADDHGIKLDGYFSLPSVAHYLIIDPDRRMMIHHKRGADALERAFCATASCGSTRRGSRPTRRRFSPPNEPRIAAPEGDLYGNNICPARASPGSSS